MWMTCGRVRDTGPGISGPAVEPGRSVVDRRAGRRGEAVSGQGGGEDRSEQARMPVSENRSPPTRPWRGIAAPSIVVEALLDELLLDRSAVRVEAGELEVLLELEVDVVLAAAVLLDRDHDPVAEALRLVRVELDVDLGDDVVLLVEDQDDVGLVVDRRRAAQVEVPQARRLQALLVGGDDAIIGTSSDSAMSLRPLTMYVTFSVSVSGSGICGTFWR